MSRRRSDSSDGSNPLGSHVVRRQRSSGPQGTRLREAAAQMIKNMVETSKHLELSGVEQAVSKTFVLDRHIKAIGLMAEKFKFAVSIRESGSSTLRCLALGAAAKGHDILEKTIKQGSIQQAYPDNASEVMADITAAQIDGYVGHWDLQAGGLIGIYVGPEARDEARAPGLAACLRTTADGKDYYPIDIRHLGDCLQALKRADDWASIPFTGDYDLHDLLNLGRMPGPVTQGTEEEWKLLASINAGVAAVDQDSRPYESTHKNVVRHGPQYNFVAHMAAEEGVSLLPGAVAKPSFPLAMCDRGRWSIIQNLDELGSFYKEHKLKLKTSWAGSEDYFESHPDKINRAR